MAGTGPPPKPPRPGVDGAVELAYTVTRGPDLPDGFPWPAQTLAWWDIWRDSPQSALFSATDWAFLADTALLHATAWASAEDAVSNGTRLDTSQHAELRLRVAKFGATVEDRLRLAITLVPDTAIKEVSRLDELAARRATDRRADATGS